MRRLWKKNSRQRGGSTNHLVLFFLLAVLFDTGKRLWKFIRKQCGDNANILGLFFGIAVLTVLLPGIFSADHLGTVDNGRYEPIMRSAGLTYLESDLADPSTLLYDRVIEQYGYDRFSYLKLLAPNGENSVIYLISLIRLLTQPFGLNFSTVYLAALYALLFSWATYVLVRSCGHMAGRMAVFPGIGLLMAASSPNLAAYFNSLFTTGTVVVGILLMTASAARLLTYGGKTALSSLLRFLAASVFCLNASPVCLIFAPFVIAVTAVFFYRECRAHRRCVSAAICAVILLSAAISSASSYHANSPDIQSDASAYHAAFQGFLPASKTPVEDLASFGLDASYAADVGNSYYMEADAYAHNPRDPAEASALFQKLNASTIGSWYLRHPLRLLQTMNHQTERFNSFESMSVLMVGQHTTDPVRITRFWTMTDTLMQMLLPANYSAMTLLLVLQTAAAIWVGYVLKRAGKSRAEAVLMSCTVLTLALGFFGYALSHLRYMGSDNLVHARMVSCFCLLLGSGGVCMAMGFAMEALSAWFREKQALNAHVSDIGQWQLGSQGFLFSSAHSSHLDPILNSRRATTLAILLLACGMSAIVQFSPIHAGCVNNGDFGRMMDQLGIIWQGDIYYNTDAQLGHRLVEEYAYRGPMDWTTLTPLNPKYSLVYPAALTRLICDLLQRPFSTWILSILMNVVLVACVVSIVRDLFSLLGRYTLALGCCLCAVFLCESYLVWFNSLFGESCMFLGLFLFSACCVHLAVTPPGKSWPWVFLLIFGARILVCAKAQMLTTMPFVLLLVIFFALYHRPLPLKGLIPYTIAVMILCVLLPYECLQIYQDNSRVSDNATVWQSTFYGALMVTDDPEGAMEELGIDKRMLPDIGKDAYQPDDAYVISPNSPEAKAALYDHVNSFVMVKYYLRHPGQLLKMLNHAAEVSQTVYNGFRVYSFQDYQAEHDTVQRLGLWMYWRHFFTCGSFLGYVLLYGMIIAIGLFGVILNQKADIRWKLLTMVCIGIALIGAVQYPLSVIGNGFADNHKQMFGFMMCHDFLVILCLIIAIRFLREHPDDISARLSAWKDSLYSRIGHKKKGSHTA